MMLIVAYFVVCLGLAGAADSGTTAAIESIKQRSSQIEATLLGLDKNFTQVMLADIQQSRYDISDTIREQMVPLAELRSEAIAALEKLEFSDFFERQELEITLIKVRKFRDAFKLIAVEISSHETKLFNWASYSLSEPMQTSIQLSNTNFNNLLANCRTVRDLLAKLLSKGSDPTLKSQVQHELDTLITNSASALDQIVRDYTQEQLKLNQEDRSLNIIQKFHVELLIDSLAYLKSYATEYKETLKRL